MVEQEAQVITFCGLAARALKSCAFHPEAAPRRTRPCLEFYRMDRPLRETMGCTPKADGEGFEPPVFLSILRFSRPTLSTAQTSIPFALRPPYLSARWQVGAYLCDSLRLLAPIGGLYCLPVSETFPVVRIATLRLFLYDNMHRRLLRSLRVIARE